MELLDGLPSAPSSSVHSDGSSSRSGGLGISLLSFLRMHPRHFTVVQEEEVLSAGGVVKRWHVRTSVHGTDGVQRCTRTSTSPSFTHPHPSGKGSGGNSESHSPSGGGRTESDNLLDNLDVTSLFLEEEMKNVLKSTSCAPKKAGDASTHRDGRKENQKRMDHGAVAVSHASDATRCRHRLQSILPPPLDTTGTEEYSSETQEGRNENHASRHHTLWSKECRMVWERAAGLLQKGEMLSVFQLRARLQARDPELLEWLLENPSPSSSACETSSLVGDGPSAAPKSSPTGFRRLLWQHRQLAREFLDYDARSVEGWVSRAGELQGLFDTRCPVKDGRTATDEAPSQNDVSPSTRLAEEAVPARNPRDVLWTKDFSPPSGVSSSTTVSHTSAALKDEEFGEDWVVELNLEEEEEENVWTIEELGDGEELDDQEAGGGPFRKDAGSSPDALKSGSAIPPLTKKQKKQLQRERAEAERQKNNAKKKKTENLPPTSLDSLASPEELLAEHTRLAEQRGWYTPAEILDLLVECVPTFPVPIDQLISSDGLIRLFGVHLSMRRLVLIYRYYFLLDMERTPSPSVCLHPTAVCGVHPHAGVANAYYTPLVHAALGKDGAEGSPAVDAREAMATLPMAPKVVEKEAPDATVVPPMTSSPSSPLPPAPPASTRTVASPLGVKSRPPTTGAFPALRRTIKSKVPLRDLKKKNVSPKLPADVSPHSASVNPSGMVPGHRTALQRASVSAAPAPADPSSTPRGRLPLSTASSTPDAGPTAHEKDHATLPPPSPVVPMVPNEKHNTQEGGPPQGKGDTTEKSTVVSSGSSALGGVGATGGALLVGRDEKGRVSGGKPSVVPIGRDRLRENLVLEALHCIYDPDEMVQQGSCDHSATGAAKDHGGGSRIPTESGGVASSSSSSLRDVLVKLLLTVPYTHFTPLEEIATRCGTDVDTLEDVLDRSQVVQSRYAAFLLHTAAAISASVGNTNDVGSRPARRRRLLRLRPLWVAPNSTGDLTGSASSSSSNAFALPASFLRKLLPTFRPLHRIVESMPEKERKQLLSAASHSSSLGQYLSLFGRSTCWVEEQLGCGPSSMASPETPKEPSHASSHTATTPILHPQLRVRRYTGDLEMDDIEPIALRALYYCCHTHEYRSLESALHHAKRAELLARKRFGLPTTMGGGAGLVLGEGIANMLSEITLMSGEEKLSLPRRISRHPTLFEVSGSSLSSFSTTDKSLQSFLLRRRTLFTTANFMHSPHKKQ